MRTLWYVGNNFATKDFTVAVANHINKNIHLVEKNMEPAHVREAHAKHRAKIAEKRG